MTSNYFAALDTLQLLDAYEAYQKHLAGAAEAPGPFADALAKAEAEHPGHGLVYAANDLLALMARQWYLGLRPEGRILDVDDDVWLVRHGEIKEARVVRYVPDGEDYIYWVQRYDAEVLEELHERVLGRAFFLTELAAARYLENHPEA